MRLRMLSCLVLLVCVSIGSTSNAAAPSLVNYSGVLTNAVGGPLSGTFDVDFALYGVASGGIAIWVEAQSVTTDANGRFNVLLGSNSPINAGDFIGANRWLGITVESDPQMTPRTRIVSTPYAFRIETVDGATGGQLSGSLSIGSNQAIANSSNFMAGDSNTTSAYAASVTAGINNEANGGYSIIGGGRNNETGGTDAGIVAGSGNLASGLGSFIGGGIDNIASGSRSAIPGGWDNEADGSYSFAAGHHARANEARCFVWNGNSSFAIADSQRTNGPGSVTMRGPGGFRFFSSSGTSTTGAELVAGSGSWSSMSDRNSKENVDLVDGDELLARLSLIPIAKWNYIDQEDGIRHIGPMAQDFYAAFGVGEADTHISNVDADGVALAAIQALAKQVVELRDEIERLTAEK